MKRSAVLVIKGQSFSRHLNGMFHLENPKRIDAFEAVMDHPSLAGKWREVIPRPATLEEIALIHTGAYIEKIANSTQRPFTSFDFDTQATADSFDTARLAVGAVFCLIDAIREGQAKRGYAFVRPPGHHAGRDEAMGFCLFNNTALGAAYLKARYGVSRTMIVDIDAHHGNGIQDAFYDTDEVLYLSFHLFPGFPGTGSLGEVGRGRGEGFTVNVPLGKGQNDEVFAQILYHLALPLARAYRPEMILVPCGFDLYLHDRMGGMRVSPEGYALLTHLLIEIAETVCSGQIAFIQEGGYSMQGIRECGLRVMQELCGVETLNKKKLEKFKDVHPSRISVLKKPVEVQRKYWNIFD
jgi:acetoin utilization deacetylase AcuC-like enzyme